MYSYVSREDLLIQALKLFTESNWYFLSSIVMILVKFKQRFLPMKLYA